MANLKDTIVLGKLSVLGGIHSSQTISGNNIELTGDITVSNIHGLQGPQGAIGFNDAGEITIVTPYRSLAIATDTLDGNYYYYDFPAKGGTVALTSDLDSLSVSFGNPVLIGQYDGNGQCSSSALASYNFFEIVICYTDDNWFSGANGFVSKVISRWSLLQHSRGTLIPLYDSSSGVEKMGGLVKVVLNSSGTIMSWSLVDGGYYIYNYDDTSTKLRFKIYGIPLVIS